MAMLQAGLSARGYEKTQGVILLEGILRDLSTFGFGRDPDLYYLTLFGTPSDERPWSWRFEGHHLSLPSSPRRRDGSSRRRRPSSAPIRPACRRESTRASRVLGAEEDLGKKLLGSPRPGQRRAAVIAVSAPATSSSAPIASACPTPRIARVGDERRADKDVDGSDRRVSGPACMRTLARRKREKIEKGRHGAIRFAWAGGTSPGEGHYYRVQGPTFLIEYDNTQERRQPRSQRVPRPRGRLRGRSCCSGTMRRVTSVRAPSPQPSPLTGEREFGAAPSQKVPSPPAGGRGSG
jgi:hypothetical protein